VITGRLEVDAEILLRYRPLAVVTVDFSAVRDERGIRGDLLADRLLDALPAGAATLEGTMLPERGRGWADVEDVITDSEVITQRDRTERTQVRGDVRVIVFVPAVGDRHAWTPPKK